MQENNTKLKPILKTNESKLKEIEDAAEENQVFIYKITYTNGKIYIGQTNKPAWRWYQHKNAAKIYATEKETLTDQDLKLFYPSNKALAKYGAENCCYEVIFTCQSRAEANLKEPELIKELDSTNLDIGYNICEGGGAPAKTQAVKEKISLGLQNFYANNPSKMIGFKHTEESKEKMSQWALLNPEVKATNKGKSFNIDWKANISQAQAGEDKLKLRTFSPEKEKEICDKYNEGVSMYKLAQDFCGKASGRSLIAEILKRNNIEIRKNNYNNSDKNLQNLNNKYSPEKIEEEKKIVNRYLNEKITRKQLSKETGIPSTSLRELLLRHQVDLKTREIKE